MHFELPDILVKALAGSRYTRETIKDRLSAIQERDDPEARRERAYLLGLLDRAED